MRSRPLLAVCALILAPAVALAQPNRVPVAHDVLRLHPRGTPDQTIKVTLLTLGRDSLVGIRTGGDTLRVPLSEIERLALRTGRKSQWLLGAGIGAGGGLVVGTVIGLILMADDYSDLAGLDPIAGAVLGTTLGAVTGGIIGATVKKDRWTELDLEAIRVRLIVRNDGGLTVAFGRRF